MSQANRKMKVSVGLSGGVDSAAAAAILVQKGYDVAGFYIEAYNEPGCRTDEDKKDALKVALQLGIRYEVIDLREEYKEKVVEYFYREYERGRTPNPDIVCNEEIKFGVFYDEMMARGYDYVASGHYARIVEVPSLSGSKFIRLLQRARDIKKDQSYFLWRVASSKLKHILFPLGELTKDEVRAKARQLGLGNADKPDSMGVCMMGQLDVREFLYKKLGERKGEIVMKCGSETVVVGEHNGLWFYTIGERRGIAVDKKILKNMGMKTEDMSPLYVIRKDVEHNRLIVGTKEECYTNQLSISNLQFVIEQDIHKLLKEKRLYIRIRNLGELYEVEKIEGEMVTTKKEMEGVAGGQSAVMYMDTGVWGEEVIVGGGVIV